MISFLVIWITSFFKNLVKLHEEIGGKWRSYLVNLCKLKCYTKANPKGRLDLHDVWKNELENGGLLPFEEETKYANPKVDKSEDLYIFGSNTAEKTTIQVYFKRRPLPQTGKFAPAKDQVEVNFKLYDGQGNTYWMEEKSEVEFSQTEYRASGFAFESLQANKTGRIKFRGYLKKNNDDKLVYVQIRFLCIFFSKTFDHQRNINACYLAKELLTDSVGLIEKLLEDKIEQNCQIKGNFKVENEEEVQFFYIGIVGRRFLPNSQMEQRQVVKINGYTGSKGIGFQVGVVRSGSKRYRYGYMTKGFDNWKVLQEISLTKDELENLTNSKSFGFEAKFVEDPTVYKFQVTTGKDGLKLVNVNGDEGVAFVTEQTFNETEKVVTRKSIQSAQKELDNALVVALDEDCARVTDLTGGKGASLAQLKQLSTGTEWKVPNAVVITSSAYRVQTEAINDFDDKLDTLERQVIARENVEKNCQEFVKWFSSKELNEKIKDLLKKKMENEFGSDWETMLFAVRSSAANEDSSEMSAAGQMTTYLGVSGLERVSKAVVACWASQFAFVPVEYKRGYGQSLNSPMAVVVQRLVDCSSAGVIFTANPTDGDERLLTVTSNFGLGESVVSAAAEPDTFTLAVDIKANSYQTPRSISSIVSKVLGKKSIATRVNRDDQTDKDIDDGIQNEQVADGASKQSLSDSDIIRLGNIALQIASHYGNARDLEWGIVSGQLFLFQSRPITNLDSNFTNWELMHEMDTPHSTEIELYSRNHWGENFPGSSSWQCALFFLGGTIFAQGAIKQGQMKVSDFNPLRPTMGYVCNQLMFNLRGGSPFVSMLKDYPKSDSAVANMFAFFGRHVNNPDLLESIKETSEKLNNVTNWKMKLLTPFFMGYMLFFGCRPIPKIEKKLFETDEMNMKKPVEKVALKDKVITFFAEMTRHFHIMQVHGASSFGSSLKTQFLMKILKSSGETAYIESDLNLLMSHCNDVVSAEVPNMLREVAKAIKDTKEFAELSDQEALELLQSKTKEPKASELFEEFLKKHSHRGYREFDPLYMPWGKNPLPCVQVVKSMLRGASLEVRKEKPIDEILEELKTPLNWAKKQLIKYWFLPWVRDAVGYREHTKSIMIKFGDLQREVMWHIAEEMVRAGYLPEADLYFYLRLDELVRLTAGERNPLLVMKAKQRKRLYPTMNAFKFDEFVKGFRMAPRPAKREVIQLADDSVSLSGTAVTVGAIKARVCVAETIEEAVNIKPGDILLTYSTDIGWSPYFPLISGIVTEIGGTISHGAVIAREFGIPCLIAVEDACQYFKTGDIAYLDTKTGTIVKVKE